MRTEVVKQPRMTERPIHKGELVVEALSPYDVARDLGARSIATLPWVIVRRRANRWDLAAIYPEKRNEILSVRSVSQDDSRDEYTVSAARKDDVTDHVYVLELYAARSPAVPGGKYARALANGTYLEHGDLPYERIPVAMASPEPTIDVALGAASTIDLLGPQQAYDAVLSNMVSVDDAYSRGNVLVEKGHDLGLEELGGGLQKVTYSHSDGAPEPHAMQLPTIDQGSLKLAEILQDVMQVLSAINSVTRGDPQANLKSGAALALVQAMSVQHNMPIQKAFATLLRDVASRIIETYRAMATTERVIEVTGTDEVRTAQSFVGDDLKGVQSVRVDLANPLLRTVAGKKELADFYADPQRFPSDPPITRAQHQGFLTTGRLATIWRAGRSEEIGIREECEALARGEERPVLTTDCHSAHIREHKALLDGRGRLGLNDQAIRVITEHITAHGAMWVTLSIENPALLAATGQQPAPLPMTASAPPGGGAPANDNGAPSGATASDNGQPEGAMAPPGAGPAAVPGGAKQPGMPNMPTNPATGERAQVAQGGVVG
jgi:hypothetical protein